jgi:hypothetical protein
MGRAGCFTAVTTPAMKRLVLATALAAAFGGLTACGGAGTEAAASSEISFGEQSRFERLLPERRRQAALLRRSDLAGNVRILRLVRLPKGSRVLGSRADIQDGYYRPPPWQGQLTREEEAAFGAYVRAVLPGAADALLSPGYSTTWALEAPSEATAAEVWDFFVGHLGLPWVATRRKRLRGAPGELHFYRGGRCLVISLEAGTSSQIQGRFDISVFPTDPANADYC